MSTSFQQQPLKPENAARRLGIYLPAAPPQFRDRPITREQLAGLEQSPPEWLTELRRHGPHPRPVVAGRLGVSISGLRRGGIDQALSTSQIDALRANPPEWLLAERRLAQPTVTGGDPIDGQEE